MSEAVATPLPMRGAFDLKLLKGAAIFWFVIAALGQFEFAALRAINYGADVLAGDITLWNKNLIHGILPNDPIGNAAVIAHLALAIWITIAGPLQLTPQIRAAAPSFHRWNGRAYIFVAIVISLGGLYMVWSRGVLGGVVNQIAISINAVLIIGFALMALRFALKRQFDIHRRWATRLFLAASGVWFFRVGLMAWIAINQGPVGIGEELDGWFAITLGFAQYVLPLAVYELYLHATGRGGALARYGTAALIVGLTLLMALGLVMATLFMWLPDL